MTLNPLARTLALKRLHRAERDFYDAFAPGGPLAGHRFVIPLNYFSRPEVKDAVVAWLAHQHPLDVTTLVRSWVEGHHKGSVDTFYDNLLHFVLVVRDPKWYRTYRAPYAVTSRARPGMNWRLPPL